MILANTLAYYDTAVKSILKHAPGDSVATLLSLVMKNIETIVHTYRANMHCQGIACTKSFHMGFEIS
jgi:hypothetical protein